MKNSNLNLGFIAILLLLSSCIYESAVPIDQPSIQPEAKLFFKWQEQSSKDVYKIKKLDRFSYTIEMYSQHTKTTSTFSAHASILDGECFLNIRENKNEDPSKRYMIVKLEWSDATSFKIYPLHENTNEEFKTSEELRNFILHHRKDSAFYGEPGLFTRLKNDAPYSYK